MPKFIPVVSTAMTAVYYDRETTTLRVRFGEEAFFEYDNVSGDIVLDFMFADSIGREFDRLVKKGNFSFRRISNTQAAN